MTVPPGDEAIENSPDSGLDSEATGNEKAKDEQEDLATEWEAMTSNGEPERVLNQDEIDSLLGHDEENAAVSDKTGIQTILGAARSDRLPMLEVVFDRLVRLLSTSLRNFTSDNVEVSLDGIRSFKFGDYLSEISMPAMLNIFKAEEWDHSAILTVDSTLVYSMIDVLLGGRRDTTPVKFDERSFTLIERNLVERMVHVVLDDLSGAFEPLSPVNFRFERLETNPRFATICTDTSGVIVATIQVDMEDRGGTFQILFPYSTLEPVRELLNQGFMGEKFGRDSIWETHLTEELWMTDIDLTVVLEEQIMSLGQIFDLKVGSQLKLKVTPETPVDIKCGPVSVFKGQMGRRDENIAVKISDKIIKEVE